MIRSRDGSQAEDPSDAAELPRSAGRLFPLDAAIAFSNSSQTSVIGGHSLVVFRSVKECVGATCDNTNPDCLMRRLNRDLIDAKPSSGHERGDLGKLEPARELAAVPSPTFAWEGGPERRVGRSMDGQGASGSLS